MVAYLTRMPAGIPGECTRGWGSCDIEPQIITPSTVTGAPTAYGVPLVVDATAGNVGNMRTLAAGDINNAAQGIVPYGVLVRPFPTGSSQDPLGTSTPPASGPCDVLKSGYVNVLLNGTTAAVKGGPVYVWCAASTGSHVQGGFEAALSGGNTLTYPGAYFTGPADANGNTEIAINT
jgi:hypothetical protein